ncbi:MAG: hypothetical protein KDA89_01745 [Planctomycetaceae bacterium]|nr:hypothetical protein [Planctomycetaceae bacterium]
MKKSKKSSKKKATPSIQDRVASIAEKLANSQEAAKGDGRCWAFVHNVLDRARAMSFWEFNSGGTATAFAPWGKSVASPARGCIVILKGTKWAVHKAQRDPTTGKLVRSNVVSVPTLEGSGHIGIILRVSPKHIEIAQQNCTMSWKGIKPGQMARLVIPITDKTHYEAAEHGMYFFYKLRERGRIAYFRPQPMPEGSRPSSPTTKAQKAIDS